MHHLKNLKQAFCIPGLLLLSLSLYGQNPIAEYYNGPEGYPTWTDDIHWENKIDMSTYEKGSSDFIRFENARDELYEKGGGVLYYPAGEYDFTDVDMNGPDERGLMLRTGVVIVGEKPDQDPDATDGTLQLKTVFKFPYNLMGDEGNEGEVPSNWNIIGIKPYFGEELKEVDNVGVAWVHLKGASIYFGPQMTWGDSYGTAGAWLSNKVFPNWEGRKPDGTYPLDPFCGAPINSSEYEGAGKGRFVFGCVFENSGLPNNIYNSGFNEGGFFVEKFIARIGVYGSYIFVANNVLPKPTKSFDYHQLTSEGNKRIIYDYGFAMGIDINKNYCNINSNKWNQETGGYWGEGVVVKDNWVYNHGNKGFEVSGTWVTIKDNVNARDFLNPGETIYGVDEGWTLTINGYKTHQDNGSSDGFLNRAFDLAGKALWVDNNRYWKTGTPNPANDGEGILCQLHGGTWILSWAVTNNKGHDCQGNGKGYIAGWDVDNQGCLMAWNTSPNVVGHMKGDGNDLIDAAFVDNIATDVRADADGIRDIITTCPAATPNAPLDVVVETIEDLNRVVISWEDGSEEEIGFRVDRKTIKDTSWTTIAFRPRHSTGHENNEQKWVDYLAPRGKALQYRVVAVNCENSDIGAALAPDTAVFHGFLTRPVFSAEGGTYQEPFTLEINIAENDATIHYTLDGTKPTEGSPVYDPENPIQITETTMVKAVAAKPYYHNSGIIEATYTIPVTTIGKTGINDLLIYPNPVNDIFFLENVSAGEIKEISVYDTQGRLVHRETNFRKDQSNTRLNLSGYTPGEYLVHIRFKTGTKTIKVVKTD